MPQEFKNAQTVFQRVMDEVLKEVNGKICEVYLDDIVVYGKSEEEHDKNLENV